VISANIGTSVRGLRDETRVATRVGGTIVECLVQDGDLPGQPLLRPHPQGDAQ
jgi:[acyl-carrier-protein] S-malonyltransferase